jgi:hypothetical protein
MLAIVAEVDPLTEHLVLLIIAVASAGVLLLIILLAVMFWGALVEITRPQAPNLSGRRQRSRVRVRSDRSRIRLETPTDTGKIEVTERYGHAL